MKKNMYIVPRTVKINASIENFIMGSLVNDGDGTWHQDTNPNDPDTGDDGRAKRHGFWDL